MEDEQMWGEKLEEDFAQSRPVAPDGRHLASLRCSYCALPLTTRGRSYLCEHTVLWTEAPHFWHTSLVSIHRS